MNIILKWSIKRFVLNAINKWLESVKEDAAKVLEVVDKCINKAIAVLEFLKSLRAKLADNKITDEEADEIVAEVEDLIDKVLAK